MSEEHAATPEQTATPPHETNGGGLGHLLGAMEAMLAAIYSIGVNVQAAQRPGIHFRAAQEHLKNARTALGG
jgi:hypothetical protein